MLILTDSNGPRGLGLLSLDNRVEMPPGRGGLVEMETYTCTHCQAVVVMNPARVRERYKCRGCAHHICDNCAADRAAGGPCKTFSQKIDEYLAQVERQPVAGSPIIIP